MWRLLYKIKRSENIFEKDHGVENPFFKSRACRNEIAVEEEKNRENCNYKHKPARWQKHSTFGWAVGRDSLREMIFLRAIPDTKLNGEFSTSLRENVKANR